METSDFGLLLVTAIMWVAGLIMFLLPPVPGVPVYLTLGIVLPAQGHEVLGKNSDQVECDFNERYHVSRTRLPSPRLGRFSCIFYLDRASLEVILECHSTEMYW
jgi:hypothetical protein